MITEIIDRPKVINIDNTLRLRSFDYKYSFAFKWYQNLELVKLVDGPNATTYTYSKLRNMYEYLNNKGELYFIEILEGDTYYPIGDVALCRDNLPIVIGDYKYQKKGIGKKILLSLISRAKELDFKYLKVEIYEYNTLSQNLFKSVGFKQYEETEYGNCYKLYLDK